MDDRVMGTLLLITIVVLIGGIIALEHYGEADCNSKGGEYHHVGRGHLCLQPGSVIK